MLERLYIALCRELSAAKLPYTAKMVPSDEPGMYDDEIEFLLSGAPSSVSLQVGAHGVSLNAAEYEDGKIVAIRTLSSFSYRYGCAVIASAMVEILKARLQAKTGEG